MHNFKKVILVSLLTCAFAAQAEVKNYNENMGDLSFSVDVPQGWTDAKIDGGVQITSADQKTSLAIVAASSEGATAEQIADYVLKESYDANSSKQCENRTCTIKGKIKGQEVATIISTEGKNYYVMSLAGEDVETLKKIIDSIK